MTKSAESLIVSETTGWQHPVPMLQSGTGTPLGGIGSGRPLTVSAQLAAMHPTDTDSRLVASLGRISEQPPAFTTRMMFPNDRPAYRVIVGVSWKIPTNNLEEAARRIEASFRAAPEDKIASEVFKLRMRTMGRQQQDASVQEAEAIIWIEDLRCWPGDIVLDVLRTWPERPDGKWWPAWADVLAEIKARCDKRMSLANFIKTALKHGTAPLAIGEPQGPTPEQRAKAVETWEKMRADFIKPEDAGKPKETPEQALERLASEKDAPVLLGEGLAQKIAGMREAAE